MDEIRRRVDERMCASRKDGILMKTRLENCWHTNLDHGSGGRLQKLASRNLESGRKGVTLTLCRAVLPRVTVLENPVCASRV